MIKVIFIYHEIGKIFKCLENDIMKDLFELFATKNKLNLKNLEFLFNEKLIDRNVSVGEFYKKLNDIDKKKAIYIKVKEKSEKLELKGIKCPKCGQNCYEINDESNNVYECHNAHNIKYMMNELGEVIVSFNKLTDKMINMLMEIKEITYTYYESYLNFFNEKKSNKVTYSFDEINKKNAVKYINYIMNNNLDDEIFLIQNLFKIYNKINNYITLKYKVEPSDNYIKLFDYNFVKNNINNCELIYQNKEYELREYFFIQDNNIKSNDNIEIKLTGVNNVNALNNMFSNCRCLLGVYFDKFDSSKIQNMKSMFSDCTSLKYLPDISKLNISNVIDISFMFYNCNSLQYLPDISSWDTSRVINMRGLFAECKSLLYLPDISKWNVSNANDISGMFQNCSCISIMPDISKWDSHNIKYMNYLFRGCSSLTELPPLKNMNLNNLLEANFFLYECYSISILPILKINDIDLMDLNHKSDNCFNLISNISLFSK